MTSIPASSNLCRVELPGARLPKHAYVRSAFWNQNSGSPRISPSDALCEPDELLTVLLEHPGLSQHNTSEGDITIRPDSQDQRRMGQGKNNGSTTGASRRKLCLPLGHIIMCRWPARAQCRRILRRRCSECVYVQEVSSQGRAAVVLFSERLSSARRCWFRLSRSPYLRSAVSPGRRCGRSPTRTSYCGRSSCDPR